MQEIKVAGQTLLLLAERALWWPEAGMLVLADPHFGKDASFRAAGLPVPAGTTAESLQRLQSLVEKWPVRELVILGDFFHSAHSKNSSTLTALRQWHTQQCLSKPGFQWHLVPGNHDLHAGLVPADLRLELHDDPWFYPPWTFSHAPSRHTQGFTFSGHLHPVVRLKKGRVDSVRLHCYWFHDHGAVLPAFGEFTGGGEIRLSDLDRQDQIFVVAQREVWELKHRKQKSGTI